MKTFELTSEFRLYAISKRNVFETYYANALHNEEQEETWQN
jgi:hypothetical protein